METNSATEKFGRKFFIAIWTIAHSFFLFLAVVFIQDQAASDEWLALLILSAVWSALTWVALSTMPLVSLSTDGVRVRVLFRRQFYPWKAIEQAGVLYRMGKWTWYNQIVLLKANGSPRRYKDKTFLLRNIGKVIPIYYSEQAKAYIVRHYGPLDFNLADGREEKSTVE